MGSLLSIQSVVILAGYAFGAIALHAGFPEHVHPSVTIPGRGIVWLGAPMAAFLLPTAIVVTDRLLRGLCVKHPVDAETSMNVVATYDAVMLRVSVFIIGVHLTVLLAMRGLLFGHSWANRIVPLMLGVTVMSIGNLLPRTRPNLAIGIRTHRTLSDRALWVRAHRLAGYMMVACGAVIALSAIAVPGRIGAGMILLVGPAAFVATWLLVRISGQHARV